MLMNKDKQLLKGVDNNASTNQLSFASTRWLTSFGDLLTLLLCLFLALAAFSFKDQQSRKEGAQPTEGQNSVSEAREDSGTLIAKQLPEERVVVLAVSENDFRKGHLLLSSETMSKIINQMKAEGYITKGLSVSSCITGSSLNDNTVMHSNTQRLLALRSQLIDAGIDTAGASFSLDGDYCKAATQRLNDTAQIKQLPLAVLSAKLERVKHG